MRALSGLIPRANGPSNPGRSVALISRARYVFLMKVPTLHFNVTGRVQGVWFRGWTRETARALGLVGWVRNMPDGSVAGQAQAGEDSDEGRAALERFRLELAQGPPSARVDLVDAGYIDLPERFQGFEVRF
jgi:acylphosphatase